MGRGRDTACEAVFRGTLLDVGPETVRMYGGPVDTGRVKPAIERLEVFEWGVRLRSRSLLPPRVSVRDVRYEEIRELALLRAAPGSRRRSRGIRLRTEPGGTAIYFLAGPVAVPELVAAFARHGVAPAGQVTRLRLPYTPSSYVYPDAVLEPWSQ
jgi:hypothetical protein